MSRVDRRRGFTLIELMLAMAFVSALLIAVAMTVIQIANTYNRGLTLKEVNQAGNDIANELQRAIASTSAFNVSGVDSRYVPNKSGNNIVGGRLCIGQYSYIWNSGKAITPGDEWYKDRNVYDPSSAGEIRFVKVFDPKAEYCSSAAKPVATTNIDASADPIELLANGEHELAIHEFSITSPDSAYDSVTGQRLYSIEFILGTNNQSALDTNPGPVKCKTFPDLGADPAYCYVNKFEIVARAGNASK